MKDKILAILKEKKDSLDKQAKTFDDETYAINCRFAYHVIADLIKEIENL